MPRSTRSQSSGESTESRGTGGKTFHAGLRGLGVLIPTVTRPTYRAHSPAAAQLLADWPTLAGPLFAARAQPKRLSGGTLTLACSGPTALELQHTASELIQRLNGALGRMVVERLRFVPQTSSNPAVVIPQKPVLALAEAQAAVSDLPEGPLRDALEALGRRVLVQARHGS